MAPLTGPQVEELAGLLCAEFQPEARLETLVLVTLDRGLFTDFAGTRQPLRVIAFQLVEALEKEGLTALLLRGALAASNRSPKLVDFCTRVGPELLTAPPPATFQVAAVLSGLNSVRARLTDPAVRAAVIASRNQLQQIGSRIQRLDLYKRLHDGLHMIQVSYFRQVVDATRRFQTDTTAADTLDEYLSGLQTLAAQARATAAAIPDDGTGLRDHELRWVGVLDGDVVANLRRALHVRDPLPARLAAVRLKTLLTFESARVNHVLTEVARQLPLNRLIDTLQTVADAAGSAAADGRPLRDGLAGVRQLYPRLIGHIAVHTQWQRVENELWLADDSLDDSSAERREEFVLLLWPTVRADVQALIDLDRQADWARDLGERAAAVDAALAGATAAYREAFRKYRRQAMLRFFQVDLSLRELCGAIAALGDPVTALLQEALDADH